MKLQKYEAQKLGYILLRAATWLVITTELFALGVLSYLGTFTRYLADDYCEMLNIRSGPLVSAVFQNYMNGRIRAANRFSHLLFVGWSEMLGSYNVQLLPGLMIVIWLIGLAWSIHEARKLAGIQQSAVVDWFLASALVFFSALQAPNRFQTFFWRSSVTTHFAPVVFMFLLSGFILFRVRSTQSRLPVFLAMLIVFVTSFIIGGVSEPATAVMFVVYLLALLYIVWRRKGNPMNRTALILLASGLSGTSLALCALFFAPGNLLHGKTSVSILPSTIVESAWFAIQFMWDTIRTSPLPTLISILLPGLFFFCLHIQADRQLLSSDQKGQIKLLMILVPLLHFLLVAVSFAPSAYGQDFPVERARFLGRFLMTSALIFEGVLFGVWLAQINQLRIHHYLTIPIAVLALFILGFYPLRAGFAILREVESYRSWAATWDVREAGIYASIAAGEQDLTVRWLPNRYGVKDIDGSINHWMNKCVATFYGANTIRSVPMGD